MGMYDSVWVKCPQCNNKVECQSKSGDCCLSNYELEDAPSAVLFDVNRHAPHKCKQCGARFEMELTITAKVKEI